MSRLDLCCRIFTCVFAGVGIVTVLWVIADCLKAMRGRNQQIKADGHFHDMLNDDLKMRRLKDRLNELESKS